MGNLLPFEADICVQDNPAKDANPESTHPLQPLGYKIYLDRYALKDATKKTISDNDLVIVCVDLETGQREIGHIESIQNNTLTIRLQDNTIVERDIEHVDKPIELQPIETTARVAKGAASVEKDQQLWEDNFRELMDHWKFVPAGRILTAAGSDQQLSLFNCYLTPMPKDSRKGILDILNQQTEIMSRGGGVGITLSSLRPRHAYVKGVNGRSSGAVSWAGLYSYVTGLIEQGGSRRGALLIMLDVWHPDLLEFINSKRESGKITNANISVAISDEFMDAVKNDDDWHLVFPDTTHPDYDDVWEGDLESWRDSGRPIITYKTMKARDIWNQLTESAWASAEPGLWFKSRVNQMSNSHYFAPLIGCNPCGEQSLPANAVCNLGSLNLPKFLNKGPIGTCNLDWDALKDAVQKSVRFLDNVIDINPYFLEANREQQLKERRIGLGTMGLGELLIRMGIRYGSNESIEFIEELYKFITETAYETSIELAQEKGAFPAFDAEQFLNSGFMLQMNDTIREGVKTHGIRNVTLITMPPTGCVAPDTLISTTQGILPIEAMGNPEGKTWQAIENTEVFTDSECQDATLFYINGQQPVRTIRTHRGFEITATLNHKLKVIDEDGKYTWRQVRDIQHNDTVVLKRNTASFDAAAPELEQVFLSPKAKSENPTTISVELAEILGFYMGNGYVKEDGGIHLVVCNEDPDLIVSIAQNLNKVWGEHRHISLEERKGCTIVSLTNTSLVEFFAKNGLKKETGNRGEGAASAFIPNKILAGGQSILSAFLRGLFEADGSCHRGTIALTSVSKQLIHQTQTALLALGIVATTRTIPHGEDHWGDREVFEVRILNRNEASNFSEMVGFLSNRKKELAQNMGNASSRGDNIKVRKICEDFYHASAREGDVPKQEVMSRMSNKSLNMGFVRDIVSEYPELRHTSTLGMLAHFGAFFDTVEVIEEGVSPTFDISVPIGNTYIANGFVSHNTTATCVGTSTGIEPYFYWEYDRKSRLGVHTERASVYQEWLDEHGPDVELPDYFVTAMDLSPEGHVKVLAAIQKWVDSSISKTSNLPTSYTVDQTRELYELMYDLGCKGGTVYRDKSRDVQVLNLKEEQAETEIATVQEESLPSASVSSNAPKMRPRPNKRTGATVSIPTPSGTAHITMNDDEVGPFEVFIDLGKAGSDIQAMTEAMGRLISLILRMNSPLEPLERVEQIATQLKGIGGASSIGFGPKRILSLADAVGKAMMEHYHTPHEPPRNGTSTSESASGGGGSMEYSSTKQNGVHAASTAKSMGSFADLCPSCGQTSYIRSGGCASCSSCGHSSC